MLDQSVTVMQVSAVHLNKSAQGSRLFVITATVGKGKDINLWLAVKSVINFITISCACEKQTSPTAAKRQ